MLKHGQCLLFVCARSRVWAACVFMGAQMHPSDRSRSPPSFSLQMTHLHFCVCVSLAVLGQLLPKCNPLPMISYCLLRIICTYITIFRSHNCYDLWLNCYGLLRYLSSLFFIAKLPRLVISNGRGQCPRSYCLSLNIQQRAMWYIKPDDFHNHGITVLANENLIFC